MPADAGRINQRRRTRKDLLAAAARLLREHAAGGRAPTMDDVAAAAMVSRATAYRYFPSIEALLIEAPIDGDTPDPDALFANDPSTDPADRIDRAEAALHEVSYRNEAQLRLMLAASLERAARAGGGGSREGERSGGGGGSEGGRRNGSRDRESSEPVPIRKNRRTPLIEAALAPARHQFADDVYDKLCAALALIFGTESMIVFTDVLGLDRDAARSVKSWAARALVDAALRQSGDRNAPITPRESQPARS